MGIMRMGYVHVRVTDLAEAKNHYANTLGLYEVLEEDGRVYYKGWDERDHHSVVLVEGGVGLVKFGFEVQHEYDIDEIENKAETFGCTVERMTRGENPEVSDGSRIHTPSEHLFEVYHSQMMVGTEVGTHNPESFPRHLVAVGVPGLDHALVTAEDVKGMERFLTETFGFYATERVQTSLDDDADYIATWMTSNIRSLAEQLVSAAKPCSTRAATGWPSSTRRSPARWPSRWRTGAERPGSPPHSPTARHTASWSATASSPSCPRSSTAPRHCRT